MAQHDAQIAHAKRAGGAHVLAITVLERFAPNQTAEANPTGEAQRKADLFSPAPRTRTRVISSRISGMEPTTV